MDYRYKADKFVNNSLVTVSRDGVWTKISWQELRVGELVQVRADKTL